MWTEENRHRHDRSGLRYTHDLTDEEWAEVAPLIPPADPGHSPDNEDASTALADFPALTLVDTTIRRRKAFASAAAHGLLVDEAQPIDAKAVSELSALASLVFNDDAGMVET
jgi:hypothetical protein